LAKNVHLNCPGKKRISGVDLTIITVTTGANARGGGDRPFKTYESNFIHHDFVQFGRQHSQYKANLASSVISRATNFLTEKLKKF